MHAEMRLFNYHLLKGGGADYYGIAKLCCALCNYMFNRFDVKGYRGAHTGLFKKWSVPNALENNNKYMEMFLGQRLYQQFLELKTQKRRLESPKKGKVYNLSEVCFEIIKNLGGINSKEALKKLSIGPEFYIQGSSNHSPE